MALWDGGGSGGSIARGFVPETYTDPQTGIVYEVTVDFYGNQQLGKVLYTPPKPSSGGGGSTASKWVDDVVNGVSGQRNTVTGEFNPYPSYAQSGGAGYGDVQYTEDGVPYQVGPDGKITVVSGFGGGGGGNEPITRSVGGSLYQFDPNTGQWGIPPGLPAAQLPQVSSGSSGSAASAINALSKLISGNISGGGGGSSGGIDPNIDARADASIRLEQAKFELDRDLSILSFQLDSQLKMMGFDENAKNRALQAAQAAASNRIAIYNAQVDAQSAALQGAGQLSQQIRDYNPASVNAWLEGGGGSAANALAANPTGALNDTANLGAARTLRALENPAPLPAPFDPNEFMASLGQSAPTSGTGGGINLGDLFGDTGPTVPPGGTIPGAGTGTGAPAPAIGGTPGASNLTEQQSRLAFLAQSPSGIGFGPDGQTQQMIGGQFLPPGEYNDLVSFMTDGQVNPAEQPIIGLFQAGMGVSDPFAQKIAFDTAQKQLQSIYGINVDLGVIQQLLAQGNDPQNIMAHINAGTDLSQYVAGAAPAPPPPVPITSTSFADPTAAAYGGAEIPAYLGGNADPGYTAADFAPPPVYQPSGTQIMGNVESNLAAPYNPFGSNVYKAAMGGRVPNDGTPVVVGDPKPGSNRPNQEMLFTRPSPYGPVLEEIMPMDRMGSNPFMRNLPHFAEGTLQYDSSGRAIMYAPDGSQVYIPADRVSDFLARGYLATDPNYVPPAPEPAPVWQPPPQPAYQPPPLPVITQPVATQPVAQPVAPAPAPEPTPPPVPGIPTQDFVDTVNNLPPSSTTTPAPGTTTTPPVDNTSAADTVQPVLPPAVPSLGQPLTGPYTPAPDPLAPAITPDDRPYLDRIMEMRQGAAGTYPFYNIFDPGYFATRGPRSIKSTQRNAFLAGAETQFGIPGSVIEDEANQYRLPGVGPENIRTRV